MAFTINHIVLVGGNLTDDAKLQYASTGNARLTFSVAMNRSYKDQGGQVKDVAEFFNIVYWGKLAESVAPYLKKGQKVAIEGRLSQRRYTTQDGQSRNLIEVTASSVIMIGSRGEGGNRGDAGNRGETAGSGAGSYDAPRGGGGYGQPRQDFRQPPTSSGEERAPAQTWQNEYADDEGSQFFDDAPMEESDVPF